MVFWVVWGYFSPTPLSLFLMSKDFLVQRDWLGVEKMSCLEAKGGFPKPQLLIKS